MDDSEASQRAQQYAQVLANAFDAEIHALFVLENGDLIDEVVEASASDKTESELTETAESTLEDVVTACEADGIAVQTSITSGHLTDAILEYIDTNDVDLVVMGAHSRGQLSRFLRESIDEQVAQAASVPVLTVRSREINSSPEIRDILVVIDGVDGEC